MTLSINPLNTFLSGGKWFPPSVEDGKAFLAGHQLLNLRYM